MEPSMQTQLFRQVCIFAGLLSLGAAACGDAATSDEPTSGASGSGDAGANAAGTAGQGSGGSAVGEAGKGNAGSTSAGGANAGGSSGGQTPAAGMGGRAGTAGSAAGKGGSAGSAAGTENSAGAGGSAPTAGSAGAPAGGGCTVGPWPEADPAAAGPFATVTETNVGPAVGEGEDGGDPVAFTMFRPMELGESGLCHPVITWGNGTGSTPSLYGVFLRHLASHGFVVIASDSTNVSRGDPQPMVAGVSWVLEQNEDPASALYQHIDATHVGATGHSQGGFATTSAAGDERITAMAPLCGAQTQRNLAGAAFFFCGGLDDVVPCDGIQNSFEAVGDQPAMFANYLTADHANWVTFRGTTPSPVEVAVTAWMRVHLMGDTALRSRFYGADCELCTDEAWEVLQKNLDP